MTNFLNDVEPLHAARSGQLPDLGLSISPCETPCPSSKPVASSILGRKENLMSSVIRLLALAMLFVELAAPPALAGDNKIAKVGLLGLDSRECGNEPLRAGLRELGRLEGGDFVIECRHGRGQYDTLQHAADELVRTKPDVIVAPTHLAADAAQGATAEIPIVFIATSDPVTAGFAASLAHPGGNMTGLSCYVGELNAKRLELLKGVAPGIRRVAVLSSPYLTQTFNRLYLRDVSETAEAMDLRIRVFATTGGADLERAFDAMETWGADALYILPSIIFASEAQHIADLASWHELPTMHWYKPYAAMGGLMAYGVDYPTLQRRAALYVDKILKGSNPADLPIEQPTHYELVINRETATELGLTIPRSIALRADRIID
jgi:putative tryptophan/tyrosine transport system substrate-binding protein